MDTNKNFVPYENEFGEMIYQPAQDLLNKKILSGHELLRLPAEPNNYLVDKLIWQNQIVVLLAREKVGKSLISLQLSCAMSCGGSFLEEFDIIRPLKVLYIQAEGDRYETVNNIKSMTSEGGVKWNPDNFYHWFPSALALDYEGGLAIFDETLFNANIHPDIIFIDPLYMSMMGKLTDDQSSRMFCRHVRQIQERFRCAIIINHHEHRPVKDMTGWNIQEGDNAIMGSFVWKAFPSHIIRIELHKDNTRTMSCHTQRNGNVVPNVKLILNQKPLMFKTVHDEQNRAEQIYNIFISEKKSFTQEEIHNLYGIPMSSIRKAMSQLIKEGRVFKVNTKTYPVVYSIKKEGELWGKQ